MGLGSKQSDIYDSIEYRTAFMNFVCRGVPIPTQYKQKRDDQVTTTTDASAVIPTTLMNEIIRGMSAYGNVWAKVRKLNVQGGA